MSRTRAAFLACLLALALAGPAGAALPSWVLPIVGRWNENIQPADAIQWLSFHDENGQPRVLYFRKSDLPPNTGLFSSHPAQLVKIPLFELDHSPKLEKLDMGLGWNKATMDVATFSDNEVSWYYLRRYDDNEQQLAVSRYDRPQVWLSAEIHRGGDWYLYSGVWNNANQYNNDSGEELAHRKIVLLPPQGMSAPAASPLTAQVDGNSCRNLSDYYLKPGNDAFGKIMRQLIPEEMEYWQAPIGESLRAPGLWDSSWDAAVNGIKFGSFDPANAWLKSYRARARREIDALRSAGKDDEVFLPGESRLLACRMRHVGAVPESDFYERLKEIEQKSPPERDAQLKAFVAYWRIFLDEEFQTYLNTVDHLPPLPQELDLKAYDQELAARTQAAIDHMAEAQAPTAGTAAAPPAPSRPPSKPSPARRSNLARKKVPSLQDAENFLNR